jgi:putative NADH-flavin reductase
LKGFSMANAAPIDVSSAARTRILKELFERCHTRAAVACNPERLALLPGVSAAQDNAMDRQRVAALFRDHNAYVSAARFTSTEPEPMINAIRASGMTGWPGELEA